MPFQNAKEAALLDGVRVYGVSNLKEAIEMLKRGMKQEAIKISIRELTEKEKQNKEDYI